MIRVSFVLPAYKCKYLELAIRSILAQTWRDFELVVVDDCSPDDIRSVVSQFSDDRIRYYRNEVNIGGRDLVDAWHKALSYAQGEFCVLASDDDLYAPEYLEEMIRLAEKYPKVDVFHCRIAGVDGAGKWLWVGDPRGEYETPVEMFYNTAVKRIALRAPDIMFRLSALKAIGGFVKTPQAWYTDIGTWVRLSMKNGACCSPRVLFFWRESGLNISNRHSDVLQKIDAGNQFLAMAKGWMKEVCPTNSLDEHLLALLPSQIAAPNYAIMRLVMRHAPFGVWLHALRVAELPLSLKIKFVTDRIRRLK